WLMAACACGRIPEVFEWCCPATASGHGTQLTAQFRFSVRLGRNDAVGLGERARLARTSRILSHEPPKPSAGRRGRRQRRPVLRSATEGGSRSRSQSHRSGLVVILVRRFSEKVGQAGIFLLKGKHEQ